MSKIMLNRLSFLIASVLVCFPFVLGYSTDDNIIYTPVIKNPLEMEKSFILFFGILALLIAASKYITTDKRNNKISRYLAILFSMFVVFGKSYESIGSWGYIFSSFSGFLVSLCSIAGYGIIFYYAISMLFKFIFTYNDILLTRNGFFKHLSIRCNKFFETKSLLKIWLILLLCWLPYAIIDYPAVIHADSGMMLGQYLSDNINNHHPVVQTIIWGNFVKFGNEVLGSYNAGVFLFVLIQLVYGSFIVALLFDYVYKKGYPSAIIFLSLLVIALAPAFPRNATAVCKDSNYTFYVLLMVWLIFKTLDNIDELLKSKWYLIPLWLFTILLVCFSRKNGIHLVLLTLPFVLFYIRKNMNSLNVILVTAAVGFGLYFAGEHIITDVYNIGNNDTRETYSIPFQQTARYVRDYGHEVTYEEREAINAILDYDSLGSSYSPELSNPVKDQFKPESTKEDFQRYLGVWFKQFTKHPTVYIQATLNGVYGYFYPDNIGYYKDLFFMTMCVDTSKIYAPESLNELSHKLVDNNMESRKLPVIGVFSSLGFFVWMNIFIILFFVFYKKDKKFLVYNMPTILTILICVASPVNNTMRYGLPVMFMVPVLFCMCFNRKTSMTTYCE